MFVVLDGQNFPVIAFINSICLYLEVDKYEKIAFDKIDTLITMSSKIMRYSKKSKIFDHNYTY